MRFENLTSDWVTVSTENGNGQPIHIAPSGHIARVVAGVPKLEGEEELLKHEDHLIAVYGVPHLDTVIDWDGWAPTGRESAIIVSHEVWHNLQARGVRYHGFAVVCMDGERFKWWV